MKTSTIARNFIRVFGLMSLVLSACEKLELDKEFIVKVGEDKKINSHLSFKIDSIWDSRCPADMNCLTSGDVTLFYSIKQSQNHVYKVLSLSENQKNPLSYDGYLWKILEVNPFPISWDKSVPIDFSIKMIISKD
jgi:hypothetical protein